MSSHFDVLEVSPECGQHFVHVLELSIVDLSLCQVSCLETLGSICLDVYEPGQDGINDHDQDSIVPEIGVPNSLSEDEPSHQENSGHTENMSCEFVVSHWGVWSNEGWASFAILLAFTSRIAERNSRHVDIAIGIGSDQIEEACEDSTGVVAAGAKLATASLRMADEKFDEMSWKIEEGIKERSTNNATPVFADKSLVWSVASSFIGSGVVPVGSSSWDAEGD